MKHSRTQTYRIANKSKQLISQELIKPVEQCKTPEKYRIQVKRRRFNNPIKELGSLHSLKI